MSTDTLQPGATEASETLLSGWTSGARLFGRSLLVGWLALLACALLAGERPASMERLESDVATGRTEQVRVVGAMRSGEIGYSVVRVEWRTRGLRHFTEVVESSPISEAKSAGPFEGHPPIVAPGVAERLLASRPDLRVQRSEAISGESVLLGWRLPMGAGAAAWMLGVLTLGLLVSGPQPWRATRWAWAWLFLLATPILMPVYLLVGGPSGLAPPRRPARRLRGGWAFLIALVIPLGPFR